MSEHHISVWSSTTLLGTTWRNECSCGWRGNIWRAQLLDSLDDANREARTHLDAAYPVRSGSSDERGQG